MWSIRRFLKKYTIMAIITDNISANDEFDYDYKIQKQELDIIVDKLIAHGLKHGFAHIDDYYFIDVKKALIVKLKDKKFALQSIYSTIRQFSYEVIGWDTTALQDVDSNIRELGIYNLFLKNNTAINFKKDNNMFGVLKAIKTSFAGATAISIISNHLKINSSDLTYDFKVPADKLSVIVEDLMKNGLESGFCHVDDYIALVIKKAMVIRLNNKEYALKSQNRMFRVFCYEHFGWDESAIKDEDSYVRKLGFKNLGWKKYFDIASKDPDDSIRMAAFTEVGFTDDALEDCNLDIQVAALNALNAWTKDHLENYSSKIMIAARDHFGWTEEAYKHENWRVRRAAYIKLGFPKVDVFEDDCKSNMELYNTYLLKVIADAAIANSK